MQLRSFVPTLLATSVSIVSMSVSANAKPWLGYTEVKNNEQTQSVKCPAALIASEWLVTTNSCVSSFMGSPTTESLKAFVGYGVNNQLISDVEISVVRFISTLNLKRK